MPRSPPRLAAFVPGLVLGLATLGLLLRYEPYFDGHVRPIGPDFSYFAPRLLANDFWIHLNGWFQVPWFTPGFCGGVPAWANPQLGFYSIPQWLTSIVDPARAIQITFALSAILGAAGGWLLLHDGLKTSRAAALLGAIVFLMNGFYPRHLLEGHLTFHAFMFTPWVAWLCVRPREGGRAVALDGLLAGIIVAVQIQAGMVAILPPIGLAWLAIGLLAAWRGTPLPGIFGRLALAMLTSAALCASNLVAMGALAKQFPRNYYPLPGFASIRALLRAVFHGLFLRADDLSTPTLSNNVVSLKAHEWDFGVSPVPLVILAAGGLFMLIQWRSRPHQRLWIAPLFVGLFLVPLAANFYTPHWNAFLKRLPVIASSATLLRWFVFYVPVLAVMTGLALDRLPERIAPIISAVGVAAVCVWALSVNVRAEYEHQAAHYNPALVDDAWKKVRTDGQIPPVTTIDLHLMPDGRPPPGLFSGDDEVTVGISQVFCYEPIFGYLLEHLPWHGLHTGPALDVSHGVLNVKNPACDLYPRENRCRPGSQFTADQIDAATSFLSWSPWNFEVPRRQKIADWINVVTVVVVLSILIFSAIRWSRRQAASRS